MNSQQQVGFSHRSSSDLFDATIHKRSPVIIKTSLVVAALLLCGCSRSSSQEGQKDSSIHTQRNGVSTNTVKSEAEPPRQRQDNQSSLETASQLWEKNQNDPAATAILKALSDSRMVVVSKPSGLPVYVAPFEALKEGTKRDDTKTELAESYASNGIPRAVGCKEFLIGSTPIVVPKPTGDTVICVVRRAAKGEEISATRSWKGQFYSGYGKVNMAMGFGATIGWKPMGGTFLLWDGENETAGQIQVIDNRSLAVVASFRRYQHTNALIQLSFDPGELFEPISNQVLPMDAFK